MVTVANHNDKQTWISTDISRGTFACLWFIWCMYTEGEWHAQSVLCVSFVPGSAFLRQFGYRIPLMVSVPCLQSHWKKKKTNELSCCVRSAPGSCPVMYSFELYLPWFFFIYAETKAHMNDSPPFVAKWSSVYLSHIFPQHCSKQTVWSFSMEQNHKDLRTNCKKRNKNRCIVFAVPEITPDTKQQVAAIWLRQKIWTRNMSFLSSVSIF